VNRDPTNNECTRDPIFLLLVGAHRLHELPDGIDTDGESWWIENRDLVPEWCEPFIDAGGEHIDTTAAFWKEAEDAGIAYTEWRTETVFLTRKEAEEWAAACAYRWELWRVYCVPCEGELAGMLAAADDPNRGYPTGVWFQAAASGLWYTNRHAAGSVRAVNVDGVPYTRQPNHSKEQPCHENNGTKTKACSCGEDPTNASKPNSAVEPRQSDGRLI